jgi:amidase
LRWIIAVGTNVPGENAARGALQRDVLDSGQPAIFGYAFEYAPPSRFEAQWRHEFILTNEVLAILKRKMPHRLTLKQMAHMVRTRQVSCLELVDAHLRQIEKFGEKLNAFVMQFPSEARAISRQLDREPPQGPLHGIPMTVKDSFDIRDLPTLCGSRFRLHHRAPVDSTAVRCLREAGAIILGKTNCPEFLANYETDNYITGRTNNPWNPEYTAGGSSGGEAAAIASYCSAGGVGSDGGGSVRIPAHFCGIAGLKPTPGRVSAAGHFPEITHPGGLLGVAGPMARTVADLRILFEVLAGYDPADPFSVPVPIRKPLENDVRIGLMETVTGVPVQDEVRAAVRKAGQLLEGLGFEVEPFQSVSLSGAVELWWFFFAELPAPFTRQVLEGREADAHWTGTEFVNMVAKDVPITGQAVVERLAARDRMRSVLLAELARFPILLTPACAVPAFRHRERSWQAGGVQIGLLDAMSPATPFNLLSLPGLVLPMTMSSDGLPIGVQLVAGPYQEETLLAIGERLEESRGPMPVPPQH